MSVIFIPPSSAASIADATETSAGKIRIATSAEATAGTNDVTAMTPAKVKAVVDAAVAGGVTYKGTFDAGSPADLSNALKGDLYIISGAGTYAGRSWAVGDHLLVNADMGGTLDSSKLDKIDSTDSVTSVAGRTGAVVLSAGDVSGLATVATSGSYNDLSNKPTLGTAAALDVGTSALNVVQLDASARLPAVDGSLLINLPVVSGALDDLSDVTITSVADRQVLTYDSGTSEWVNSSVAYADVSGTPTLATVATSGSYNDLSNKPTLGTAAALDVGTSALNVVQLDGSAKLPAVDGSQLTNLPSGASTLGALSDVTITSVADRQVLTYDSASGDWVNSAVAYADVSGTPTLATVATSGSYNDLSNKPTLGTAAALDVGTSALNIVQLDASAKLPAIDGSQLTNLPSGASTLGDLTDVTITSVADRQVLTYDSASSDWINSAVAYADVSGTPTLGTAAALDVGTSALNVVQLDASSKLPAVDGSQLTNLPSGASTLGALSDVTLTSVTNGQVLTYDSASGDWVNASNTATFASVSSYSASATLSPSSNRLIRASNTITLTLPAASASTVGSFLHIKNVGVNVITVAAAGADTIDGGASVTIDIPKNSISVYCISASAWEIF